MYIMSDTSVKTTGRVKWFNKNAGYGFITAIDGDNVDQDIFVHHSSLTVEKDQFRYLVEGEYVSFDWSLTDNESEGRKWQATSVSGVCMGPLMCETQNEARSNREAQNEARDNAEDGSSISQPLRRGGGGKGRGGGGRSGRGRGRGRGEQSDSHDAQE